MKPWLKWAIFALVVVLLASAVLRALSARKTQQAAVAAQATQRTETVFELGAADVVQVKTRELAQGLPISGALRAVDSAFVKARVAGELQDLSVREGDAVKAGQIIARIDSTESQARLRQGQQQAEAARAQVDIARRNVDNNRALVAQGFISGTALDTSTANLAAAQASYRAAQAGAEITAKSMSDTVLRAPIAGLISQRLAQPGERVAVDARIVEIVNLSRLELEATLSAGESLQARVGQRAQLQIEGAARPVSAKVVRINPSALAGSRAVLVYLAMEPIPGLRQGLYAQGTLGTGQQRALALPMHAVRTDKPLPYVQLVVSNRIRHQRVELGERGEAEGQTMVTVKGLPENATVIAGSVGALRDGSAVNLKTGATSPAGSP